MKATIFSIIKTSINRISHYAKGIVSDPTADPMEGMSDEQKIEFLKQENKMLRKRLVDANREILNAYDHLWGLDS